MKQLKHRQNVLAHRIEAMEGDMLSITKETFEELDYLKRELELTGYNIKVLTTEIKNEQFKLSRHMERIMDNSNSILFLSSTIARFFCSQFGGVFWFFSVGISFVCI